MLVILLILAELAVLYCGMTKHLEDIVRSITTNTLCVACMGKFSYQG